MTELLFSLLASLAVIFLSLYITIRFGALIFKAVVVGVVSSVIGMFIAIGFLLAQLLQG
jgi:hypothetical protein